MAALRITYRLYGLHGLGVPLQGELCLPTGARGSDAAAALGVGTAVTLFVRNGRACPASEPLTDGDELRLVGPVDGG